LKGNEQQGKTVDQQAHIEATKVSDAQRMRFLPNHFGARYMMRGEALVYAWARRLIAGYTGGFWQFYEVSNGGFYLVPEGVGRLEVSAPNGSQSPMSPEAAGMVATLYALCQMANDTCEDHLIEKYHALREYAVRQHPEGGVISRAID